jgi:hypothetical protein
MAVWPVCPGLAYQFNKKLEVSDGWVHLYQMGWIFAVCVSTFTYVVLGYIFKDAAMFEAQKHPWESFAEIQKDLLDREQDTTAVLEGSSVGETDSEKGVQHTEKEYMKGDGLVTVG